MRTKQRLLVMVVVVMVVVEYKGLGHLLAVQLLLPQPRVNTMNILSSVCLAVVNTISQSDITNICMFYTIFKLNLVLFLYSYTFGIFMVFLEKYKL